MNEINYVAVRDGVKYLNMYFHQVMDSSNTLYKLSKSILDDKPLKDIFRLEEIVTDNYNSLFTNSPTYMLPFLGLTLITKLPTQFKTMRNHINIVNK